MNALCAQIQQEKNYEKFEELTRELNILVGQKERRFPEHECLTPSEKGWKLMSAIVTRAFGPTQGLNPGTVEIRIPEAADLFREIRFENRFIDARGQISAIRNGARLDVKLEADLRDLSPTPPA